MRTNYVLIDYENVRPESLASVDHEHFKTLVFTGSLQNKVPTVFADTMQRMGHRAAYVRISGNGRNALDFHIAFYIGQLAAADPTAFFHIISDDKGFDPLIQHLKAKKILAGRVKSIGDIPLVKTNGSMTREAKLQCVLDRLQNMKAAKPRTVKTLGTTISALFQKRLPESEVESLIKELKKRDLLEIKDNKVSYALPQELA